MPSTTVLGKKPEPTIRLLPDQIAEFWKKGFLQVDDITTPGEIERLRTVFVRLFEERAGREQGNHYDLTGHDEDDAPMLSPQIINPHLFAEELSNTQYETNAQAIARQLFGDCVERFFEHAILKPPKVGAPTTWHQDEAFREDLSMEWDEISIWMPLQEVTVESGCLHFVPGMHKAAILPHRSPNNDTRIHGLECFSVSDPEGAVAVPLRAGCATIHHSKTPHYAGPNQSDVPRFAYVKVYRTPPRKREIPVNHPWMEEKNTLRSKRQADWRNRGGIAGKLRRKARTILAILRSNS
jgi:hypothetical protein